MFLLVPAYPGCPGSKAVKRSLLLLLLLLIYATVSSFHAVGASVFFWRCIDTLCTSGFVDDMVFAHGGMSIPLQRRRCSVVRSSQPPAACYWLHAFFTMAGAINTRRVHLEKHALHHCLVVNIA